MKAETDNQGRYICPICQASHNSPFPLQALDVLTCDGDGRTLNLDEHQSWVLDTVGVPHSNQRSYGVIP